MNKSLCVIPARGGSKRIPKKNIKDFCGKPMIAWSIEAAVQSQLFDEVIVSSDIQEIIAIAEHYGASAPFIRPKELADDYTGTTEVIKHAVDVVDPDRSLYSSICCLYATAPFICKESLRAGKQALNKALVQTSFSATSFAFPIQRAIKLCPTGGVEAFYPEFMAKRSQDLTEAYHDAGQFYWWRRAALENGASMFSTSSEAIILSRYQVQDIDTQEDWQMAEYLYQAMNLKNTAD
ncbi:pseudaminic acid cytidylyltransferase [Agarivorans sp. QJM3NY_33]|uniref:pseudaminic acid cytidylyltransferase n=1 Tax=Agarivorans sp. QJM3NY_33 TaxID=3421432 RepID=UPI003D7E7C71